jgi:hypothetical protein
VFDQEGFLPALPVPVGVHPDREQGMDVDHPPGLSDLQHQGVSGQERVRALIQRPGAERLHLGVQVFGHDADLRAGQPGDAQGLHQLLYPSGGHPNR